MTTLDLDLRPHSILRLEQAASEESVSALINGRSVTLWFVERNIEIDSETRYAELVYRFALSDPDALPDDFAGHIQVHIPIGRAWLVHRS